MPGGCVRWASAVVGRGREQQDRPELQPVQAADQLWQHSPWPKGSEVRTGADPNVNRGGHEAFRVKGCPRESYVKDVPPVSVAMEKSANSGERRNTHVVEASERVARTCAGLRQPSVFRGRLLSSVSTARRSSAV